MNTTNAMPTTHNESFGFYGTMRGNAAKAWPLAMTAISNVTGSSPEVARHFLDSAFGRHLADEVRHALHAGQTLAAAIDATTTLWMKRRVGTWTSRTYGIPCDLPHLTGFTTLCEIEDELAA
ncbi:hypothetical protein GO998_13160 [Ralstonia syzygii]|uniref:Uncharacterized protein n=1 Tax=Ralstonia syzygii TaxID=28097 RepID=A0ABX7ZHQ6_9RALS|nr:hypothetical protein [Ralstonia syzygii]QUP54614.1 hypothetical protein GO998_13160 [Ralstonia syzygii]